MRTMRFETGRSRFFGLVFPFVVRTRWKHVDVTFDTYSWAGGTYITRPNEKSYFAYFDNGGVRCGSSRLAEMVNRDPMIWKISGENYKSGRVGGFETLVNIESNRRVLAFQDTGNVSCRVVAIVGREWIHDIPLAIAYVLTRITQGG